MSSPETIDSQTSDIFAALNQPTEHKAPGSTATLGWNFDDDESNGPQSGGPSPEPATGSGKADNEFLRSDERPAAERLKAPRVPDEVKRASAQTATAAVDSLLTMACVPLIERKMRKRLTEEELDKGPDLEDRKDEELQDEELRIKKKWMRTMKLREHKLREIPLNSKEEKNLETAFYNYFKIKDIAMPPEWLLYISLSSILIDRVIEVVTD